MDGDLVIGLCLMLFAGVLMLAMFLGYHCAEMDHLIESDPLDEW